MMQQDIAKRSWSSGKEGMESERRMQSVSFQGRLETCAPGNPIIHPSMMTSSKFYYFFHLTPHSDLI
jgi:hypothetical protein